MGAPNPPELPPVQTTGSNLLSKIPILGGVLDFLSGERTNAANRREAQKNRQFQERMSSTAIRRAVADYTAAGLNPALAYDRSASSPGGAQADVTNSLKSGISTARELAMFEEQKKLMKSQSYAQLQAGNLSSESAQTQSKLRDKTAAEIDLMKTQQKGLEADLHGRNAEGKMWQGLGNVGGPVGAGLRVFLPLLRSIFGGR